MQEKQRAFLVRTAYWAVWTALLWLGVRYLLRWLLPFILALGLAALVEPVIAWCRRRMGLKRGFTAAVVTIAVTAAILALAAVIVWQLIRQAAELLTRLPTLLAGLPGMTAASWERGWTGPGVSRRISCPPWGNGSGPRPFCWGSRSVSCWRAFC